jgi:Domain of unknown function (DUF2382)
VGNTPMFEELQQAKQEGSQVDLNQVKPNLKVITQQVIPLLEERLMVNFTRQKIAEIVVRKEIETRTIKVPVRREKLIVEQLTPVYKHLAEVDLGEIFFAEETSKDVLKVNGESNLNFESKDNVSLSSFESSSEPIFKGEFSCIEAARNFLDTIPTVSSNGYKIVRIEVVLKDLSP